MIFLNKNEDLLICLFVTLQICVLFFSFILISNTRNGQKFNVFQKLTIIFILYNTVHCLFPSSIIPLKPFLQKTLLLFSCIITPIYYLCFIYEQHRIINKKLYNIKTILSVVLSLVFTLFVIPFSFSFTFEYSEILFISICTLILLAIFINSTPVFKEEYLSSANRYHRINIILEGLALFVLVFVPSSKLIFNDNLFAEILLFNLGFIMLLALFIRQQSYINKIQYNLLENFNEKASHKFDEDRINYYCDLYRFNIIEKNITKKILEGFQEKEIFLELDLLENVLKKNVASIYRKTKTKNREDFMKLFCVQKKSIAKVSQVDFSLEILKSLEDFEKNNEFLNPNINMTDLAKKMKTNSKYLSKTINQYKHLNFNNYINKLRIQYTISLLNKDPKYKRYAIKYLSNEVGFNYPDVFSKAFKTNIGIYPSEYIKNLIAKENCDKNIPKVEFSSNDTIPDFINKN